MDVEALIAMHRVQMIDGSRRRHRAFVETSTGLGVDAASAVCFS